MTKGGAHPASDDNRHTFKDLAESMATGPDPLLRIPHLCHFTGMVTVVNHSCNGRDAVLLDKGQQLERRAAVRIAPQPHLDCASTISVVPKAKVYRVLQA